MPNKPIILDKGWSTASKKKVKSVIFLEFSLYIVSIIFKVKWVLFEYKLSSQQFAGMSLNSQQCTLNKSEYQNIQS